MTDKQPEALRLADSLQDGTYLLSIERDNTAAELRRLHAANLDCIAWYESVKAERDELLKALLQLVEDLEMRSNWKIADEKGVVDCGNGVYLKARAAIAKSTGDTK